MSDLIYMHILKVLPFPCLFIAMVIFYILLLFLVEPTDKLKEATTTSTINPSFG